MPTCPKGHRSTSGDYCDECGVPINAIVDPPTTALGVPGAPGRPSVCPQCGAPQSGRFCEADGYDFVLASLGAPAHRPAPARVATTPPAGGAPPGPVVPWRVMAVADPEFHQRMETLGGGQVETPPFPPFCPERRFSLTGSQLLIGRHSRSRGIEPDIDLTGPPEDAGVSHAHALLVAQPAGGWAVVDLDSANGTYLNGGIDALAPNVPVVLSEGDRVHVGAWTTLIVQLDR
jgi:FHA domain